jgi:hypothetical protein
MCRTVHIHPFSLQDGSVYGTPPSGRISHEFVSRTPLSVFQLSVTRSRIMAHLSVQDETGKSLEMVVVWDMKTGDPVSSL